MRMGKMGRERNFPTTKMWGKTLRLTSQMPPRAKWRVIVFIIRPTINLQCSLKIGAKYCVKSEVLGPLFRQEYCGLFSIFLIFIRCHSWSRFISSFLWLLRDVSKRLPLSARVFLFAPRLRNGENLNKTNLKLFRTSQCVGDNMSRFSLLPPFCFPCLARRAKRLFA